MAASSDLYHLRYKKDGEITAPGGKTIKLNDYGKVEEIFNFYVPDFHEKLATFPRIHDIPGGVLYGHYNDDGDIRIAKGDQFNEAGYKGEIFEFWTKLVGRLNHSKGILLHSLSEVHATKLFVNYSRKKDGKFEIDWTYISDNKVAVIQVGYSEGEYVVIGNIKKDGLMKSKIHQVLTSSIPSISKIIRGVVGDSKENSKNVYGVVCLPGHTNEKINEYLQSEYATNIQELLTNDPHLILFITKDTIDAELDNSVLYELTQISGKFTLSHSGQKVTEFFGHSTETDFNEARNVYRKVAAYLSLSYLLRNSKKGMNLSDEPEVNEEKSLLHMQERYRKQQGFDQFDKNILLSPQQWQILQRNDKLLYIDGKPGSGKTSLLVMKALKEAQKVEEALKEGILGMRKRILFILPASKSMLKADLEQTFKNHDIDVLSMEEVDKDPRYFHDVKLVLVDQLDLSVNFEKIQEVINSARRGGATVWAAWVAMTTAFKSIARMHADEYVSLNTLFRSASHISETVSFMCDMGGFSSLTPHTSVFASEQTSIPVSFFNVSDSGVSDIKLPKMDPKWSVGLFYNAKSIIEDVKKDWKVIDFTEYADDNFDVYRCHFTGIEFDAVVIVVESFDLRSRFKMDLLNCIISRAKFEVHVYLHEHLRQNRAEFVPDLSKNPWKWVLDSRFEKNNRQIIELIESGSIPALYFAQVVRSACTLNLQLLIDLRDSFASATSEKRERLEVCFDALLGQYPGLHSTVCFLKFRPELPIETQLEGSSEEAVIMIQAFAISSCTRPRFQSILDFALLYLREYDRIHQSQHLNEILESPRLLSPDVLDYVLGKIDKSDSQLSRILMSCAAHADIASCQILLRHIPPDERFTFLHYEDEDGISLMTPAINSLKNDEKVIDFIKFIHQQEISCSPGDPPSLHLKPNSEGYTPFVYAMLLGSDLVVQFLLAELKCDLLESEQKIKVLNALTITTPEVKCVIREYLRDKNLPLEESPFDILILVEEPDRLREMMASTGHDWLTWYNDDIDECRLLFECIQHCSAENRAVVHESMRTFTEESRGRFSLLINFYEK